MKTTSDNSSAQAIEGNPPRSGLLDALARRIILSRLSQLQSGRIALEENGASQAFGRIDERCPFSATIHVHDPRFYSDIAFGGSIGAGEAFMAGHWSTDDLTALVRIALRNRDFLSGIDGGLAALNLPVRSLLHWLNRNTRKGSRRNISAHYDLGNELFSLMLDETMMYSSAVYADESMDLHRAQLHRLDQICRKLELGPADHLLEIGAGWGGLAIHAAREYGCRVTTTTISREQHALAVERVAAAGLADRVSVLMQDYRELDGRYDKLVSIEMIEAIGFNYYDAYFERCGRLLKPEGMMLLQAITIADQNYEATRCSPGFIQKHIFPGGNLPSVTVMLDAATRKSDLRLYHLEDIGPHYARTLRDWRANVARNVERIRALGYSETFLRMWDFYLCYCEGSFLERAIGNVQMLLVKPDNRRDPLATALYGPAGQD